MSIESEQRVLREVVLGQLATARYGRTECGCRR